MLEIPKWKRHIHNVSEGKSDAIQDGISQADLILKDFGLVITLAHHRFTSSSGSALMGP